MTDQATTPASTTQKAGWWDSLTHFFHNAAVKVGEAFIAVFGQEAAHNLAVGVESVLKTDLGKIAWAAVQETQGLASGTEKQAKAFAKITSVAEAEGIDAKASIVNMLIELCVQRLKGSFGPA